MGFLNAPTDQVAIRRGSKFYQSFGCEIHSALIERECPASRLLLRNASLFPTAAQAQKLPDCVFTLTDTENLFHNASIPYR